MVVLSILIATLSLAADRVAKYFVIERLRPVNDIPIWDGILHLHYAENTGAAFGLFPGARWMFYAFTVLGVGIILIILIRGRKRLPPFLSIACGLVMGGAIGNLIDRIQLGYVIDFIYVKAINFAIFNVADACVVIGSIMLCIYLLFMHDRPLHEMKPSRINS